MTAEQFQSLFQTINEARRFHSYPVELHGGRHMEVDFPGSLGHRDGIAAYLSPGSGFEFFDHKSVTRIINDLADAE